MDRLDELATFVAVAEQGSFVGAARHLGRSPAAVTRAVAALEDRLATRLFNRTTRAVALTDAGRAYEQNALRHARAIDLRMAGAGRVEDEPAIVGSEVRVGVRPLLGVHLGPAEHQLAMPPALQ